MMFILVWMGALCLWYVFLRAMDATGFVLCGLPITLAVLQSVAAVFGTVWAVKHYEWLAPFVFGFAAGGAIVLFLRQWIIDANPFIAASTAFDYYWLFAVIIAGLTGMLTIRTMCGKKMLFFVIVTCAAGSYGAAVVVIAIVELVARAAAPGYVFFVAWPVTSIVAFVVQVWLTSPDAVENREETRKRYHDALVLRGNQLKAVGGEEPPQQVGEPPKSDV